MNARSGGGSVPVWFGVIWLVAGLPFLLVGIHTWSRNFGATRERATATEIVSGTVITKRIDGRGSTSPTYFVTFRYVPHEGQTVRSDAQIDGRTWSELTELGPIPVRYARSDPTMRTIPGEVSTIYLALIFTALGGLFAAIGAVIVVYGHVRKGRRSGLRRDRVSALGKAAAPSVANSEDNRTHPDLAEPSRPAWKRGESHGLVQTTVIRRAWRSFAFRFGLAFAAAGVMGAVLALQSAERELQYRFKSQHVTASVIDKIIKRADPNDNAATQYLVRYRFISVDGSTQYGSRAVPFDTWEAVSRGSPLPVYYLPARAFESRIAGTDHWVDALGWGLIGVIFGSIGAAMLAVSVLRARLVERLIRSGTDAEGTVDAVGPSSVTINGVRMWRVRYRFSDGAGASYTGKSELMTPQAAHSWRQGDTGTVRFDPADPRKSIWTPGPTSGGKP